MDVLIMVGQLMLSLSLLIVLHEFGHFAPARWFGTRVEKFYLFFNPGFELFKKKIGETEYGIGWLPLGGYVKISGMVDESFDAAQLANEPQPWEFRTKPAWQRLIIMLGGVTVNFLLGFFIFAMVLWAYGEEYMPSQNMRYGIYVDSLGQQLGLQNGDKVLGVDGKPMERFSDRFVVREIIINDAKVINVEREGKPLDLPVDASMVGLLTSHDNKDERLFAGRFPFVAAGIAEGSPAEKGGLMVGDSIIALNGQPTPFFDVFLDQVSQLPSQQVIVTAVRNGELKNIELTTTAEGRIGVAPYNETYFFDTAREEYSLFAAIPAGISKGWGFLDDQVKAFGQIFRGRIKASESLGGFASIGKMFGDQWMWERFWTMTAILSLILAFMNLLPIPALDGGHVVFLLYEVVSGRKPSDKFMETATMVGFIIVLGLVLYANGLDVVRYLFK